MVRLPNICNYDSTTTVAAHLNGAGVAIKHSDILSARTCSSCHAEIDRLPKSNNMQDIEDAKKLLYFYEGIFRTQLQLIDEGLIEIK